MRLKDLISKNDDFRKAFKNIDIGLLNSIVCGISSNSKNISRGYIFCYIWMGYLPSKLFININWHLYWSEPIRKGFALLSHDL